MTDSPLEELQSLGPAKREEETVKEYVERVGDDADVDPGVLEGAVEYVTGAQYSASPPEDDAAFRALLGALGGEPPRRERAGSDGERDADSAEVLVEEDPFEGATPDWDRPETAATEPENGTATDGPTAPDDLGDDDREPGSTAADHQRDPEPTAAVDHEAGDETDPEEPAASTGTESEPDGSTAAGSEPDDSTAGLESDPEGPTAAAGVDDRDSTAGPGSEGHDRTPELGDESGDPATELEDEPEPSGPIGLPPEDVLDGTAGTGFKSGIRGKEPRKLLLRFVAIALLAPVIGWFMGRTWVPEHALYARGQAIAADVLGLPPVPATELVAAFGLGFYLGLLALFTFDVKKRVQGVLLFLGTALALGVLGWMGVLLPNLDLASSLNLLGLGLGFVAALTIEAGRLFGIDPDASSVRRPTLRSGKVAEFRYAAMALFGLSTLAIALSLVQAAMAGAVRLVDVGVSGVAVVLLFQFVQYESETSYMTLGPERSGKSMLLLGLCLRLLEDGDVDPKANDYLQDSLERASNLRAPADRWPIPSTAHDEVSVASFEVISGYYFPRRLELAALDYAGQHLGRLADLVASGRLESEDSSVPQQVADWLVGADTLLFVLDVERLEYPEQFQEADVTDEPNLSWGLEHYGKILEHTDYEDVVVVATKCDILVDSGHVDPPTAYDSFDAFGDAVEDHLTARPDVEQLLQTAGQSSIHPVYFVTEKRDGQYVPHLDEQATLVPVGYGRLVDELRRRQ